MQGSARVCGARRCSCTFPGVCALADLCTFVGADEKDQCSSQMRKYVLQSSDCVENQLLRCLHGYVV